MKLRHFFRFMRRRWVIALLAAVVLFGGYLWAGYVLAPRLIRSEAMKWARARPGLALTLGRINVDPLHITVSVRDIRLSEHGRPLAAVRRLFVGLAPLSLIGGTYHITALDLDTPRVHVRIGANGKVNLAALSAGGTHRGPMPPVRIDDLRIERGRLTLSDHERSPAARETLAPITIELVHFRSWGRTGGRFAFRAAGGDGTSVTWWGRMSMAPLASAGGILLADAPLAALARFLPRLPLTPRGGRLSMSVQYTFGDGAHGATLGLSNLGLSASAVALEGGPRVHGDLRIAAINASGGTLQLATGGAAHASLSSLIFKGVRLTGTAAARGQTVSLQRLSLARTRLDMPHHGIAIGTLAVSGLRLPVRRGKSGRLALMRFLPVASGAHAPSGTHATASKWRVRLGRLEVRDALVPVRDLTVTPAAHFDIHLYSLTARALSTDLARPVPFDLHAGIAPRAYLVLDGRVTPGRDNAALWLSLTRLPLRPFVPYLPLAHTAEVHSGTLGVRGFAELAAGRLARLDGRADVRDLQLLERSTGVGLFGWRELSVRGIAYRPKRLVIRLARLTAPNGQIVILPNHSLNLAALAPPHARAGKPARAPHRPGAAAPSSAPAFSGRLERFDIVNGSITFADESITPHFHAPIDDLHGSIRDASTSKQDIAHISLAGQVINRYSPVTISGSFNPYGLGRETNIHAAFDNIQLPIFDPYSDHYAGYAIAKGILSAHFRYRIDDRALDAQHHIVVDRLQWGGPSPSKDRVGWPIRLATALLKGPNGVIRINLPVTGSLNDPDFHIASIVWTMLVHLLEKAALAPFELIGKLFAGAAQAQYIAFQPGSAALPHGAAANLAALAHALAKRPALRVDIPGGPASQADATALENEHVDALALARIHTAPPAGGFASLPPDEQVRALAGLYRAHFHKRPVYPQPPPEPAVKTAAAKGAPRVPPPNGRRVRERTEIRWLRTRLRPLARPAPGTLTALGLARAQNVQTALLAHGGVSPKRVFITTKESGTAWHGRVRLTLQLH